MDSLKRLLEKCGGVYMMLMDDNFCKDLETVKFDFENVADWSDEDSEFDMPGFQGGFDEIGGVEVLWCAAGGDWELPVAFAVYCDGEGLRGYVPRDGNCFNRKTCRAYGNGPELSAQEEMEELGEKYHFDMAKMTKELWKERLSKMAKRTENPGQPKGDCISRLSSPNTKRIAESIEGLKRLSPDEDMGRRVDGILSEICELDLVPMLNLQSIADERNAFAWKVREAKNRMRYYFGSFDGKFKDPQMQNVYDVLDDDVPACEVTPLDVSAMSRKEETK